MKYGVGTRKGKQSTTGVLRPPSPDDKTAKHQVSLSLRRSSVCGETRLFPPVSPCFEFCLSIEPEAKGWNVKMVEILFRASVHVLGAGQNRASERCTPLLSALSVVCPRLHEVLCVFCVNTVAEMNKMPPGLVFL